MRRNFLLGTLICLVPTALAGVFVGKAFYNESQGQAGFRRGIDLAGGTNLVYEVNLERSNRGKASQAAATGLSSEEIKKLAENLKRRIDPNDLKNVVVRPVGTTRVEIILPFAGSTGGGKAGATEDYVQEVMELVRKVGVLEFRFLANPNDDADGMREAQKVINSPDPTAKAELIRLAKAGLPPPAPRTDFTVKVNDSTQEGVTYEWTELGKEERDSRGIRNAFEKEAPPPRSGNRARQWLFPEYARTRNEAQFYGDSLIYSREFIKQAPAKGEEDKKFEYFVLTRVSPSDALRVDRDCGLTATVDTDRSLNPAVSFKFGPTGAQRFGKITERNRPKENFKRTLAILMDDKIMSTASLNAVIRDSGQISGEGLDLASVTQTVYILRSGALNAELKPDPVSMNTVGPTLGQDTITKGLRAVIFAFVAILAFMVVYYRFKGVVACVALLANLLLTVGFMVFANAAFTLPGLAGVVLMLGMAVDANVLINERIREEKEKGANLATAIRLGYDRAFATIIDTHLTSIFTAIVLYTFGNDSLKGFAVSLTVGLIISLFTALYVTRLIVDFWVYKKWMTSFTPIKMFARPNLNFMKIRGYMFAGTTISTLLGLALFLERGEAGLNVDFTKGTVYGGRLSDGQERGLVTTGDGKLGLLPLLAEDRQKERLKVTEVVWLTPPSDPNDAAAPRTTAENIYKIKYADGSDVVVTLANRPDGNDAAAQADDLKTRASFLSGVSVEQIYLSTDPSFDSGKSRYFTVRTTEKEKELVQVMLDRLLRDEKSNEPLLASTKITNVTYDGATATVTLDHPASPGYLREFIARQLKLTGNVPDVGSAPAVEVVGVPSVDESKIPDEVRTGRFGVIKVDVSNNPFFKQLRDASTAKKDPATDPAIAKELAAFKQAVTDAKASFEARPLPERLETFDPALAADTRNKAFYAILASWIAILGYLWFRFGSWTFGLAAVCCLIHDLCFTLGCIAACHYLHDTTFGHLIGLSDFKIDLATVAALLTLVGYSVNDTIVVFDRIREVRGKNPILTSQMINDSVNQTLSRTVLASLTVFLVVGVLYFFGGEGVHLFAFVMVVGVIVGTYSSIYIASPLLLIFGEGKPKVDPKLPGKKELVAAAK